MRFTRRRLHIYVKNYFRRNMRRTIIFLMFCVLFVHLLCSASSNRQNGVQILTWYNYDLLQGTEDNIFAQCPKNNCFITKYDEKKDPTKFDAILFSTQDLSSSLKPKERRASQVYVFTSLTPADKSPACHVSNDNFYNWTMTYRLDSDIVVKYFSFHNSSGASVAPRMNNRWYLTRLLNDDSELIPLLFDKYRALAWFVDDCDVMVKGKGGHFLRHFEEYLRPFKISIDKFGNCSKNKCTPEDCDEMLKSDYLYLLAFDGSTAVDFVTNNIGIAYKNFVVPIVFGRADYTRFIPPYSFIQATDMHPYTLAHRLKMEIRNRTNYQHYFKWTNHYTVRVVDDPKAEAFCKLCEALNDKKKLKKVLVHKHFNYWWNSGSGDGGESCYG